MTQIQLFEVGGAVRDRFLGIKSKDVDFTVVAPSWEAMRDKLIADGFEIFVEKPEFVTIRAKVPEGSKLRERTSVADFVLARKDGPSSDGRRPDWVEPGTLLDDLARRDFTINAMAISEGGELIDPFGGFDDITLNKLRFVGEPIDRIREDGLRVLRALRFAVTKGFYFAASTRAALKSPVAADMLNKVSAERIRDELDKMFSYNTWETMKMLDRFSEIKAVCFYQKVRLTPTLKGK